MDIKDVKEGWRSPNKYEAELLEYYYSQKYKPANKVFSVWMGFGILGMVICGINIVRDILKEPQNTLVIILTGALGILMLYFVGYRLGRWLRDVALKKELIALKTGILKLCVVNADGKKMLNVHSQHGRGRHRYYINTCYGSVLTDRSDYNCIQPNDDIVLLSYDERFIPACMLAKSIDIFEKLAAEKEKTQNAQKVD